MLTDERKMQAAGFVKLSDQDAARVEAERRAKKLCVVCGHDFDAHDTNSYGCSKCPCEEWTP